MKLSETKLSETETVCPPAVVSFARPPYSTVMVLLDGTWEAARTIPTATSIADASGARVEIVTVARHASASQKIERVDEQLRQAEVIVERRIVAWTEALAAELVANRLREDRGSGESTLVVAASDSTSHLGALRRTFAERVLRSSGGPLLLTGPSCRRFVVGPGGGTLLVAVEHPQLDGPLAEVVAAWATEYDLSVELIHINETASPASIVASAAAEGTRHRRKQAEELAVGLEASVGRPVRFTRLDARDPAAGILARAEADDVVAIAMSGHIRLPLVQFAIGSILMDVMHRSPCPVLTSRPEGLYDA